MDVRGIVIAEFERALRRSRIRVTPELLHAAEAPFDLAAVQAAVDANIIALERQLRFGPLSEVHRQIREREQMHEMQLKKLARQYALQLVSNARNGHEITASQALNEQRVLKAKAGVGCDVYPCERRNSEANNGSQ